MLYSLFWKYSFNSECYHFTQALVYITQDYCNWCFLFTFLTLNTNPAFHCLTSHLITLLVLENLFARRYEYCPHLQIEALAPLPDIEILCDLTHSCLSELLSQWGHLELFASASWPPCVTFSFLCLWLGSCPSFWNVIFLHPAELYAPIKTSIKVPLESWNLHRFLVPWVRLPRAAFLFPFLCYLL